MAAFMDALINIEAPLPVSVEVVCQPQEGRYYYATTFTKQDQEQERYFTTNPLTYMGRYIGGRVEGWGKDQQEWSHFVNKQGKEISLRHKPRTAFYHIKHLPVVRMPPDYHLLPANTMPVPISAADLVELMALQATQICSACQQVGHIVHSCPDDNKRQAYYDSHKPKEIFVVRSPVVGKYYEATFWDRREGHWDNEKHYSKATTKREYAGQYLRTRSEGYGDGADHWAIFLRDGKEIEIEYDYDGKRAFYEVEAR